MVDIVAGKLTPDTEISDCINLLKPRVMSLAIFTAAVAMIAAPGSIHPVIAVASILFIAIGAGASGALNMWWDADIDRLMRRTRNRPIPSGRVERGDALMLGAWLSGLSVIMLGLTANLVAAGLLAFAIFFYAVIYTMLLKRRTPQNIVIGGAAGALPPVIGWSVVTGGVEVPALLMFLLIFVWTPPHFWALALFVGDDYRKAGIPMLTVAKGSRATRLQVFAYSLALVPVSLLLAVSGAGGPVTMAAAVICNLAFLQAGWVLLKSSDRRSEMDGWKAERRMFRVSLVYLFAIFAALAVDAALRPALAGFFSWPQLV